MNIGTFFIGRPVFASVINLFVVIVGLVCCSKLPTFELPKVSQGSLTVSADYSGSSPVIMEQIASTLEKAISDVSGIKSTTTNISSGRCSINLELEDDANDVDKLSSQIENKLRVVAPDLPDRMRPPIVSKYDLNDKPIMHITLSSSKHSPSELRSILSELVRELKAITGISNVSVSGEGTMPKAYSMVVNLDPVKMYTYGISPQRVQEAIRSQNYLSPSAEVISDNKIYAAVADASLNTVDEFSQIIVYSNNESSIVRLADIADVSLEMNNRSDSFQTFDGKEIAAAAVMCQSGANIIKVAQEVKKRINNMSVSGDMILDCVDTSAKYIKASLKRVVKTIVEATILVSILTLLFFRSIISSVIPLVAIPICVAGGITMAYCLGFSINIMTLLAILLAVSLVIDDAMVVLESIYSKIEQGMNPTKAAIKGITEVQFSIIGMTLTIVAVYAPFMLSTTYVGRLFREFAFALAGMVVVSGVVALILTPMMSAKLLKNHRELNWLPIRLFNAGFKRVESLYSNMLNIILNYRKRFIFGCLVVFVFSLGLMKYKLESIMTPAEDRGFIHSQFTFPPGTRIESAKAVLTNIESKIRSILTKKENSKTRIFLTYSEDVVASSAYLILILPDRQYRRSVHKIQDALKNKISPEFIELMPHFSAGSSGFNTGGRDFDVYIKSIAGKNTLKNSIDTVYRCIRKMNGKNILQSRTHEEPIYQYSFDRDRAAEMNIRLDFLEKTLGSVRVNPPAGYYDYLKPDGSKVRATVITKVKDTMSNNMEMLLFEYGQDKFLPIVELLKESGFTYQIPNILHKDGIDAINLSCDITGSPLANYNKLKSMLKGIMPSGVWIEPGNSLKKLFEEGNNLLLMFILSVVFIYLIIAAQFESIISPFIVICTVPLAISGGIIGLALLPFGSMNIYSKIGLITLVALITKHGIMLVDLFNQKLNHLTSSDQIYDDTLAKNIILESAKQRFRPIIMTTLAMVLGSIPLLFPSGYGYEATQQIGIVIVFGLTIGTIVTTFLIPCVLTFIYRYMIHQNKV